MKRVEAYLGMDGVVYASEELAKGADERYVVEALRKELETFYAAHANDGTPMKCIAVNRRAVVEILEKYDEAEVPA